MSRFTAPMLAATYRHLPSAVLFSQPKLDGVRCIANAAGLWSRTARKITACEHIERTLKPYFDRHSEAVLDGELYDHSLRDDLAAIISLVNTHNISPEKRARCEASIQFHLFDLPSHPGTFGERWSALASMQPSFLPGNIRHPVRFVDTATVRNEVELDQLYDTYLKAGYEGQMVRAGALYEPGRSANLLKRKPFHDAEFDLVRLEKVKGSHSGYAKRAILRMPDGRTFGAGIKGSHTYAATLLDQSYTSATVRYSATTASGMPRSPTAIAFHEHHRL
jgi:DNA ligase 1